MAFNLALIYAGEVGKAKQIGVKADRKIRIFRGGGVGVVGGFARGRGNVCPAVGAGKKQIVTPGGLSQVYQQGLGGLGGPQKGAGGKSARLLTLTCTGQRALCR